jgi:hypothetical protein
MWNLWYFRSMQRFMQWFAIGAGIVTASFVVALIMGWMAPAGWGQLWYSLPFLCWAAVLVFCVHGAAGISRRRLSDR